MADLSELKNINLDLPLTSFPNTIDDLESFSDANDEINSIIAQYKSLLKQGATAEAEALYEKYSLKKYIVSAYFLNKIQHMIIACERAISSVKKYFSFSTDAPDGTTAQPNGYIWGKILSTGDSFKKVLLKLKENGTYVNIFPQTTADNVLLSETNNTTVSTQLENLEKNITNTSESFTTALDNSLKNKMDKENPIGTGALIMNRDDSYDIGTNSATLGTSCYATAENGISMGNGCSSSGASSIAMGDECATSGKYSVAMGKYCQSLREGSITQGLGLVSNTANQIVQGKYNVNSADYAYILGGGTGLGSNGKNIFTVDWDGNVAGESFTANGDIVYNGYKSLTKLETNFTNFQTELNGNYIIVSTEIGTVTSENMIEADAINSFDIITTCENGEHVVCIPYAMSKYTCVEDIGYTNIGANTIITINAINISSGSHKVLVRYYIIKYKVI